jgi:hypothetical protein
MTFSDEQRPRAADEPADPLRILTRCTVTAEGRPAGSVKLLRGAKLIVALSVCMAVFALLLPSAAGQTRPAVPERCYLFTSFRGNGEDGLHLAWSADGLKWEALNQDRSFLRPRVGQEKLMRDPCVIEVGDGTFHMVWTDGWRGRTIGYANSKDLIHWSEQKSIAVMADEPTAMNCWAPEIVYDEQDKQFVIFWATTIPGRFPDTDKTGDRGLNHRMYCTTTKDFETFTPTKLFFDAGFSAIDATILREGGKFYLIVKDEQAHPPHKFLRLASSDRITGPFTDVSEPFTRAWVEGPTAIKIGEEFVVYFDCYRDHRYGAARSKDLVHWQEITDELSFPKGMRHGTILPVSGEVVRRLMAESGQP